jgi:hypothetical protein
MSILTQQGIRNFHETAGRKDFFRQNLFRVIAFGGASFFNNDDLLYIESTTLPSKTINNVQVPYMGLQFNVPGTVQYPNSNSWSVTMRMDAALDIRNKLENWMLSIFDDQDSTGNYSIPEGDEGVTTLILLDKKGSSIRKYDLYGCYITNIGEMTLNVGTAGDIVTVPATIAYQYWRATNT